MASLPLIEILLPELHAYARWICSPPDDPDDLAQSAIERSLRTEDRPRELEELRPWMVRVIRNLHLDELRRRRIRMAYTAREKLPRARNVYQATSVKFAICRATS